MRTPKIKDTDLVMMLPNAPYIASLMPRHFKNQKKTGATSEFGKHNYGTQLHYFDSRCMAELLGKTMTKGEMREMMTGFITDAPTYGVQGGNNPKVTAQRCMDALTKEGLIVTV